jgi:elongation factor Ts
VGGADALGHDLAMHIAALNPPYLSADDVPADAVAKEKDIFVAQVAQDPKAAGKPADIVAKMVDGKVRKFLGEITLLGQPFVKDDKQSVEQVLKKAGARVARFVRFEVGAGIEKKQENFAEEVAAAVRGA